MALQFLDHLNLNGNELQNISFQKLNAVPSSPYVWMVYFNTVDNKLYLCIDGTNFTDITWSVRVDSTDTLTNKTISWLTNAISNISIQSIQAGDMITSIEAANTAWDDNLFTALAIKNYVDKLLWSNDAMLYKWTIDASTNPNFPSADAWHTYKISVAGKLGWASGLTVKVWDTLICTTDLTAGWDYATVWANWSLIGGNAEYATSTEAEAKTNAVKIITASALTNFPIKKTFTVWGSTSIVITHNLNSKDVVCKLRRASDDAEILTTVVNTTVNTTTLTFATAPASNSIIATIIG